MEHEGEPAVAMWRIENKVVLTLRNTTILEDTEFGLVPGIALRPELALTVARSLIDLSLKAMEARDGDK